MILLKNIFLPIETDFSDLDEVLSKLLKQKITGAKLYRRSVDARKRGNVRFCCSVLVEGSLKQFKKTAQKHSPEIYISQPYVFKTVSKMPQNRPVIVGFGPAGMFAGLTLARAGLRPLIIEQGFDADTRFADIENFKKGGKLNPRSNIQFGEGGAGTFSDGKLNTGIGDKRCRAVLQMFCEFGADNSILYDAKPHIGTDVLIKIVKNIRNEITALGGKVCFGTEFIGYSEKDGRLCEIGFRDKEGTHKTACDNLILAIGHSSRKTVRMLFESGIQMTAKPFSVGVRIEHLRENIDRARYGTDPETLKILGAADYKLSVHLPSGRGVYTFCMCPGGYVINASSEPHRVVTNGMSYSKRNGENSNSALLVGVDSSDFGSDHPLAGIAFQEKIEEAAYNAAKGQVPVCQTVEDFLKKMPSVSHSTVKPTAEPSPVYGSIDEILPPFAADSLREALPLLNKKLPGFADPGALLTGPETRSSSPVRMTRDEDFQSSVRGIFPTGEGAGYAGGIMSAAVDGIKAAEKIIEICNA